jgi:two-component system NarL family sensor kinase
VLPLLLRVLSESIAEVRAAEHLVRQTRDQVRHDLALDMHEAALNRLAGITILAERAAGDLDHHPATVRDRLHAIHEAARQAEEQVRFLVGQLRRQPVSGDMRAELDALLAFIGRVAPDLVIVTDIALPPLARTTAAYLIGILRNALTNVVQHAQAQTVEITLAPHHAGVRLRVCDDGVGCDPDQAFAAPGVGFDSLFEWVRRHDGRIDIQSSPGHGLCLEVWLPNGTVAADAV